MKRNTFNYLFLTMILANSACTTPSTEDKGPAFSGVKNEVKIITVDPGHFHAALVQKNMYDQVDPTVHVYAPEGPDVNDHLNRIDRFNKRELDPTRWEEVVYTGPDFLDKMISEKSGNVVVLSGNNAQKTEYIKKSLEAGFNVLADKPMVILPEQLPVLLEAFQLAEKNGLLLYDIMTERHEITTLLQKEFSMIPEVFGDILAGSPEEPAITKESVHHFFKYVSGNPIKRPAWFFDTGQQGDGLVDVSTHLVDLVQWSVFPEQILNKEDVSMISARRWTTTLDAEQFKKVTALDEFPEYLHKDIEDDLLKVYSNGEMIYSLRGIHAKVSVIWNYQAPEGAGDTHYSIMRGSGCNLIIKQGAEENYKPVLYIEPAEDTPPDEFENKLYKSLEDKISPKYPGVEIRNNPDGTWVVEIPARYHVGHEAHFGQVTEKYLKYLVDGKLPEWEVPNMITKYYTNMTALEMAREK